MTVSEILKNAPEAHMPALPCALTGVTLSMPQAPSPNPATAPEASPSWLSLLSSVLKFHLPGEALLGHCTQRLLLTTKFRLPCVLPYFFQICYRFISTYQLAAFLGRTSTGERQAGFKGNGPGVVTCQ